MATMTEQQQRTNPTPYAYWLTFVNAWDNLSGQARYAGQDDMAEFFAELADDAADVWAGFYGPLGDGN